MHSPLVSGNTQAKVRNSARRVLKDASPEQFAKMSKERKVYDAEYSIFDKHFIGIELYRGASQLDGEPIVVLATFFSCNTKTGPMVQISILNDIGDSPVVNNANDNDVSVCGNCPHRLNGTCYVAIFHGPRAAWAAWQKGRYATFDGDYSIFSGREIRWGMYGDPSLIPSDMVRKACDASDGWAGYTHQWRQEWAQWSKPYLQASCDSVDDLLDASSKGWGTFTVLPIGYDRHELPVKTSACPAALRPEVQCIQCLHCNGTCGIARHKVIEAHGKRASSVTWDN